MQRDEELEDRLFRDPFFRVVVQPLLKLDQATCCWAFVEFLLDFWRLSATTLPNFSLQIEMRKERRSMDVMCDLDLGARYPELSASGLWSIRTTPWPPEATTGSEDSCWMEGLPPLMNRL